MAVLKLRFWPFVRLTRAQKARLRDAEQKAKDERWFQVLRGADRGGR